MNEKTKNLKPEFYNLIAQNAAEKNGKKKNCKLLLMKAVNIF